MAWLFRARGAGPVARVHRGTSGFRPKRSTRLAEFRGETVEQFAAKFVRRVEDRYSLIEKPGGDCIFWDKQAGCTVYPARPVQCQTWPFWPENVETPEDWDHVRDDLPRLGPRPALHRGRDRFIDLEDPKMTDHDARHDVERAARLIPAGRRRACVLCTTSSTRKWRSSGRSAS